MRNLLNFLSRYNNFIIFIVLEGLAVYFLARGNNYHNTFFGNGIRSVTRGVDEKINKGRSYFKLREINNELAEENIALKNRIDRIEKERALSAGEVSDTILHQHYNYTSAEVVSNSVNRQKNYFTINKGLRQGIRNDMAVISGEAVAGVIVGCTENHAVAMSVLNLDFRVSARIRNNGYFGSLNWDGRSYRNAILNEIPQHVNVSIGDTIETTGYSAIFPEGVMIGVVTEYQKYGGDFYKITVELNADFKRLRFVEVIGNLKKTEELQLEKLFQ